MGGDPLRPAGPSAPGEGAAWYGGSRILQPQASVLDWDHVERGLRDVQDLALTVLHPRGLLSGFLRPVA